MGFLSNSVARIGSCLLGLLSFCVSADAQATKPKPNILFIFSDDHAYQAISAYGDSRKLIDTPNIDRIGAEGVRFERCLVTNSICGPSRAAILTGKYAHLNGFYNNTNSTFDGSQQTFAKLLKQGGYQTAVIGKWHLVSDPTGFDEWHILPGQGAYYNPQMIHNGQKLKHKGYTTDLITDFSVDWLKKRDKTKPFLLMAQHKAPHREWSPALRHLNHNNDKPFHEPTTLFDTYQGRSIAESDQRMTIAQTMTEFDNKLTPLPQLDDEQRAVWDAYYGPRNDAFRKADLKGDDLVRWKYQRYMHDYLGCVKGVDESVGRLLKTLDEEGLAENTLVVYSSDQGFFLGEHGWFDKRWIFEESLRTPLLVRWPGVAKAGQVSHEIVSNLDFAQTFLAAAGIEVPTDMQGTSFVPILKGMTPADWRKSFYYQYYEYPEPHRVRPHYGVITDRYKLIRFESSDAPEFELFDTKNDPSELRDVYKDPAYATAVTELKAELAKLRVDLKVPETVPAKAYGNTAFTPR